MTSTSAESAPFKGAFFFVNHDAKSLDARPHRQNVFTHVQSQYRKWNRQERTKALHASAKVPPGILRQPEVVGEKQVLVRRGIVTLKSVHADDELEKLRRRNFALGTRSSVVMEGNSDPFGTQAVAIDPQVNELITFFRDLVIPSIYHTGPDGWMTSKTANVHWQSAVRGLGDEGGALGFLARYAQVAAITHKDKRMATQALRYSFKSTSVLRERLEHSTVLAHKASPLSQQVYWQINMLWGTEILIRNFDAAVVHGKMLRALLEKQAKINQLDVTFLRYVLYNDSHLISSFMVRSVFDYDVWIPEQYKVMEGLAMSEMPDFAEVHAEVIDPSVESDFLRKIFKIRREHVQVWKQRLTSAGISPLMYAWLATVNSINQGQLIKRGLDAMERAVKVSKEDAGRLWVEAYLSIACLYWIRSIGGSMIICGVDIYNSQRPILEKLRTALTRADETQTAEDQLKYRNARVWALFIGAQAEQSWKQPDWFTDNLALRAREMGLMSWISLKNVLQAFLHNDMLPPHGASWYEKTTL